MGRRRCGMSPLGPVQSLPARASGNSGHVRYAPKAEELAGDAHDGIPRSSQSLGATSANLARTLSHCCGYTVTPAESGKTKLYEARRVKPCYPLVWYAPGTIHGRHSGPGGAEGVGYTYTVGRNGGAGRAQRGNLDGAARTGGKNSRNFSKCYQRMPRSRIARASRILFLTRPYARSTREDIALLCSGDAFLSSAASAARRRPS